MRILLEEADATVLWSFIILVVIPVAVLLFIVLPIVVIRKAYEKFVIKHSVALKQLVDINDRYSFKDVDLKILEHDYDN